MRYAAFALTVALLTTAAWAQGVTTEPVTTTTLQPDPFQMQQPYGDGVPVKQTPAMNTQPVTTTISTSPNAIATPTVSAPAAPATPTITAPVAPRVASPAAALPAPAAQAASTGLSKVFDEADTNHDGVVTREEFLAKAERHFGMADTNKDNKITREEMQAQQNLMMQQMGQQWMKNGGAIQQQLQNFLGSANAGVAGAAK